MKKKSRTFKVGDYVFGATKTETLVCARLNKKGDDVYDEGIENELNPGAVFVGTIVIVNESDVIVLGIGTGSTYSYENDSTSQRVLCGYFVILPEEIIKTWKVN